MDERVRQEKSQQPIRTKKARPKRDQRGDSGSKALEAEGSRVNTPNERVSMDHLIGAGELNQILLDALPCVAMLVQAGSHRIVAANRMACSVGAVPGLTCYAGWRKRTEPCPWCRAPQALASGQIQIYELSLDGRVWITYWVPVSKDLYLHYAIDHTEQVRVRDALRQSENRYRELFDNSAIPIWEEDFSSVKAFFDQLRTSGVRDFRDHFARHSEDVIRCASLVRIMNVNQASIAMLRASSRENMLFDLPSYFSTERAWEVFREEMIVLAEGGNRFQGEIPIRCHNGENLLFDLRLSVLAGYEKSLSRIHVSFIDITDRKQAEEKLAEYQKELRSLISRISMAEEQERRRIAENLHDHLGQSMVFAKMKVDMLNRADLPTAAGATLGQISKLLGGLIRTTQSITYDLSYPVLYERGLIEAIEEWIREEYSPKYGVRVSFQPGAKRLNLPTEQLVFVYRAVRELLINVAKHAHTPSATVTLRRKDGRLQISVQDHGVGFDPDKPPDRSESGKHYGLFSIRERLNHLGGTMTLDSRPGKGTCVTLILPEQTTSERSNSHGGSNSSGGRS